MQTANTCDNCSDVCQERKQADERDACASVKFEFEDSILYTLKENNIYVIIILIIQVKASKFVPIHKIHFTHLQQYDENHCVYVARIEPWTSQAHNDKSRRKRDHACAA